MEDELPISNLISVNLKESGYVCDVAKASRRIVTISDGRLSAE